MTFDPKEARALVERLRSIPPFWVDTALGVEAADALTAALDEIERLQEVERLVLAANTLRQEYHALPNERLRPGSKESRKSRAKRLWLRAFDRAARKALKGQTDV